MIYGRFVYGEVPIGALGASEDVSTASGLARIIAAGRALRQYLVKAWPWSETGAALSPVYLATHEFRTASGDDPSETPFKTRLDLAYHVEADLWSGDKMALSSIPTVGHQRWVNSDGGLDDLLGLSWINREMEVLAGLVGDSIDLYETIQKSKFANLGWDEQFLLPELSAQGEEFSDPINASLYSEQNSYGVFNGSTSRVGMGNVLDPGSGDYAIALRFRTSTNQSGFLASKKADAPTGNPGVGIRLFTTPLVQAFISDGTTQVGPAINTDYTDNAWHKLYIRVDRTGNTLHLYYDASSTSADISAVGSAASARHFFLGCAADAADTGTAFADVEIERAAVWVGSLPSVSNIESFLTADQATIDQGWPGASSVWSFGERTGSTVTDTEGSNNGTATDLGWSHTYIDPSLWAKQVPRWFGENYKVEGQLIDPLFLTIQLHDGAIEEVMAGYDGGSDLTFCGTDYASRALLEAATTGTAGSGEDIEAGEYATCLAEGLTRVAASPVYKLTWDFKGDATGSYVNTPATIHKRIAVQGAGKTDPDDFNSASYAALDSDAGWTTGKGTGTDPVATKDLMDECMRDVHGWWNLERDAIIDVAQLSEPSTSGDLIEFTDMADASMRRLGEAPVVWRVRVGYKPYHTVQERSELAVADLTDAEIADLGQPYRWVTASDSSIKTNHAGAVDLTIETGLVEQADAQSLADLVLALHRDRHDIFEMVIPDGIFRWWLGSEARVSHDRFAPDAGGTPILVVGITEDDAEDSATLKTWSKSRVAA